MSVKRKIYKQHYACFHCRKAFKKTNLLEVPKEQRQIDEAGRIVHCPQCGERMLDVGFNFVAPKKDDVKAWEEARDRIVGTLNYAIRNSNLVNVQSREKIQKFIEEYNKSGGKKSG